MHPATVIQTFGLRKQFGRTVAVDDLTVEIRSGEVFGFLGPNGAGKTTSVKMLLGLIAPTSGEARVLGARLGERSARERIGFLPEHFRFQDCLTAREFLRIHGRLHGLKREPLERRIRSLLERVDLHDAADRRLSTFSKGMLQRAGLAQALIAEPMLVFLDEPTSGLDPLGRVLVRDLIGELRAEGTTVFLNSHLLGEVEATCDRVVLLKQGRIARELPLQDRIAAFEIELRVDRPDAQVLEGLRTFAEEVRVIGDAVRLRASSEEVIPQIARWLVGQGIAIYALGSRRKSLEEWFMEGIGDDQRPG
ncbi:MAG: ABC transporter ATP-binding protein [Steroidobacteraceae bacterium]